MGAPLAGSLGGEGPAAQVECGPLEAGHLRVDTHLLAGAQHAHPRPAPQHSTAWHGMASSTTALHSQQHFFMDVRYTSLSTVCGIVFNLGRIVMECREYLTTMMTSSRIHQSQV